MRHPTQHGGREPMRSSSRQPDPCCGRAPCRWAYADCARGGSPDTRRETCGFRCPPDVSQRTERRPVGRLPVRARRCSTGTRRAADRTAPAGAQGSTGGESPRRSCPSPRHLSPTIIRSCVTRPNVAARRRGTSDSVRRRCPPSGGIVPPTPEQFRSLRRLEPPA